MYRVELKAFCECDLEEDRTVVPNVPCGVESNFYGVYHPDEKFVFLMYRVELKVVSGTPPNPVNYVPNVPCGVESWAGRT